MLISPCSRSKDVVEFLARPQWFIKCDTMAARAVEDVRQGRLTIEPSHFEKTWFNWLENSRWVKDVLINILFYSSRFLPAYGRQTTKTCKDKYINSFQFYEYFTNKPFAVPAIGPNINWNSNKTNFIVTLSYRSKSPTRFYILG